MILAKATDYCVGQLASNITSTQTTIPLKTGNGGWFPTFAAGEWMDAVIVSETDADNVSLSEFRSGEKIRIIERSGDVLTVAARSGSTWSTNNVVMGIWSANTIERLTRKIHDLELALWADRGQKDGVFRYGSDWATECLYVSETSPKTLAVLVRSGVCLVDGHVFCIREDTTTNTVTVPSTNPRIDLVQATAGQSGDIDSVSIKQGTEAASPVAPSADTNSLGIFEILLTTSHTSIANADLTDKRIYL